MVLPSWPALAAALPWVVAPAVSAWRLLDTTVLPPPAPLPPGEPVPRVSVVVPARNEARNIERLVRSVLASTWPNLELVVVDDHSSDGTGALARTAGHGDPRLVVIEPPALPEGWFGKQWACWCGAQRATGDVLLFADADTWHAPALVARMMRAQAESGADLLSVAGTQELHSFWERVVMPLPFFLLLLRFGGLNASERATSHRRVIANGQCLLMRRAVYRDLGGHEAVRDTAAEDLRLAQHVRAHGGRVVLRAGLEAQRTRMYRSLGAIVAGWSKNMYAGGKHLLPRAAWPLFRLTLPLAPLLLLIPTLLPLAALLGLVPAWLGQAGLIALVSQTTWAAIMYRWLRLPVLYALAAPLGAGVMCWIALVAAARGDAVSWAGRTYTAR
ncbi:MAG: glycosyltransferase [Gemmatimonadaceae bacterium]|nr:glycosyltransferase [Gemmatimonadaceae bacterium]